MRTMLVALALAACSPPPCSADETQASVRGGRGGYVCIPSSSSAEPTPPAPPPSSSPMKLPSPSAPPDAGSPSSSCGAVDTSLVADVRVVPKTGAPASANPTPPDGRYTLIQASAYATDGGVLPITALRATLLVTGGALTLGAQALTSTLEPEESFTLAYAGGLLTNVCVSRMGSVATNVLPGGVGATERAELGWSPVTGVLTLVVHAPNADLELLFTASI